MCGICGVVNTDGAPVSASVLRAMTDTLRHRGPEAAGVYIDATVPGVGLGHTRLRILDLREVADQPMATDDGRDRAGKKPLYYATTSRLFAFASEIKALLRHPELAPEVDTATLPAFFLYGYAPCPATLYRGLRQLPPGHVLTVTPAGDLRLVEYWDVPLRTAAKSPPLTEEAAIAEVRRLLTAAVERRLVADVPLGAFLSGGVDSSIVVGLMSRLRREPIRTFSIGFAGDP